MTLPSDTARAWVDIDLGALGGQRAHHRRSRAEPACCRWSKLTATDWAPSRWHGRSRRSIPGDTASPRSRKRSRSERPGSRRPILVVSPLSPDTLDPILEHGFRPAIGDPAMLRSLDRAGRRRRSISRSTPGWRGRASAGTTTTALAGTRSGARLGTRAGRGSSPTSTRRTATRASVATQWRRFQTGVSARCRGGRRWSTPPTARRPSADAPTPPTWSGRASSSTAGAAGAHAPAPRPVASLRARVLAVRAGAAGETVSYGAAWRASGPPPSRRSASATRTGCPVPPSGAGRPPRLVELRGRAVPIVGRVTMDMCMVAVDDGRGRRGRRRDASSAGSSRSTSRRRAAGTISYELLTSLGPRLPRRYR